MQLNQVPGSIDNRFQYLHLTSLVPSNLIHPNIHNDNVCNSKTKQSNLSLEDSLIFLSLGRIKAFRINYVKFAIILKPYSSGTSFPVFPRVEDREMGFKGSIHQCTFARALRPEYCDVGLTVWKLVKMLAMDKIECT